MGWGTSRTVVGWISFVESAGMTRSRCIFTKKVVPRVLPTKARRAPSAADAPGGR